MSNFLAQATLALIKWHGGDKFNSNFAIIVEPYVNGREQGFFIKNWKTHNAVAFSEYRTSDALVVYYGSDLDFSPQGNVPSQETYNTHFTSFSYADIHSAARWIIEYLAPAEK